MTAWRIRDPETVALVNQIAESTGQDPAGAVADLVRSKLEQLRADKAAES